MDLDGIALFCSNYLKKIIKNCIGNFGVFRKFETLKDSISNRRKIRIKKTKYTNT